MPNTSDPGVFGIGGCALSPTVEYYTVTVELGLPAVTV